MFLGMLSPNLASILCFLCSQWRYWSFFVGTLDSRSMFLKHLTFLVETRQNDFAELRPFRKQSKCKRFQILLKKESKKNKQLFWDKNRDLKYSIVLKQCLSGTLHKAVPLSGRLFQQPYIASIGVTLRASEASYAWHNWLALCRT